MTTTASIYFNRIKLDYPQAGRDNDSQGFRDNFRNIFNAFSATNADIESLKLNSVTLGGNNDFGYNSIKKVKLENYSTSKTSNLSPISGNTTVDFGNGNYQTYYLNSGTTTFLITNWPDNSNNVMSMVTLKVTPTSTWPTTIDLGGTFEKVGKTVIPVSTTTTSTLFFDVWTDDGGNLLYVQQKGI